MIEALKKLNFSTLCILYVFGFAMFGFQYMFSNQVTAQAQISAYTAVAIGGETQGVTDLCCNGVILDFDSVNPLSPWILDGEALFVPGLSSSYENGNEFSSGYNVLGTVRPGICVTVESECYSVEYHLEIGVIGTSAS